MDNLPNILTAQSIADYLYVSRRYVYKLLDLNPDYGGIKNFRLGKSRRVAKLDFEEWLERTKNNCSCTTKNSTFQSHSN